MPELQGRHGLRQGWDDACHRPYQRWGGPGTRRLHAEARHRVWCVPLSPPRHCNPLTPIAQLRSPTPIPSAATAVRTTRPGPKSARHRAVSPRASSRTLTPSALLPFSRAVERVADGCGTACIRAGIRSTFLDSRSSIWRSLRGSGSRSLGSWRGGRRRRKELDCCDTGLNEEFICVCPLASTSLPALLDNSRTR